MRASSSSIALRGATLVAALTLLAPGAWAASVRGQEAFAAWKAHDLCAQNAYRHHPDYTPRGNVARDRELRQCEAAHHLPTGPELHENPVRVIPDADAQ
jgi:hypothetical protein